MAYDGNVFFISNTRSHLNFIFLILFSCLLKTHQTDSSSLAHSEMSDYFRLCIVEEEKENFIIIIIIVNVSGMSVHECTFTGCKVFY